VGLVDRVARARAGDTEQRALAVPWDQPFVPFGAGGPLHPSQYGHGQKQALALVPVYAAVRLLADAVASLPLQTYIGQADTGTAKRFGAGLFGSCPSVAGTIYDWVFVCMTSLLLHGNAWGLITQRDGMGFPSGIEWLPPERMVVIEDQQQPWNPLRARIYFNGNLLDQADLVHIRAFPVAGHTKGMSPLQLFATTIAGGRGITEYGKTWFDSGGFPPGTFQNSELEVDAQQSEEIRRRLVTSIRRREPLVYGRDWTYHPVTVPPNEAQFVEAAMLNATQIAAIYGVPADMIGGTKGDSMTYANVEQSAIAFITDAVRPWLVRLETAFFDLIPAGRFVRFNADARIKTDIKTRYEVHQIARAIGLSTVNEMRAVEDMEPTDPVDIGDETLPLDVLTAMSRGMKATPKSFSDLIDVIEPPPPPPAPRPGAVPVLPPSAGGPPPAPPDSASSNGSAPSPNGNTPAKAGA
jgi:HK97 family phage portal protein